MMRIALGLVLGCVVAGCAMVQGPAVPDDARLSETVLTLRLSDGTVCHADWKASGGSGRFDDCGEGFDYRVTEAAKPNPLRQAFVAVTRALGIEGAVSPMAEVIVSGRGRAWRFVSPPRLD